MRSRRPETSASSSSSWASAWPAAPASTPSPSSPRSSSAVIYMMYRFNFFALNVQRQVVKVQVPADGDDFTPRIDDILISSTDEYELISTESIRGGSLIEYSYTAKLQKGVKPNELINELRAVNVGQKATVLTGYDQTDM